MQDPNVAIPKNKTSPSKKSNTATMSGAIRAVVILARTVFGGPRRTSTNLLNGAKTAELHATTKLAKNARGRPIGWLAHTVKQRNHTESAGTVSPCIEFSKKVKSHGT